MTMIRTSLARNSAMTVAILFFLPLVAASAAGVRGGGMRGGGHDAATSTQQPLGGTSGSGRSGNFQGNRNVNPNVDRDVNINVDNDWDHGLGHPVAAGLAVTAAVGTSAAIGSMVSRLPQDCNNVVYHTSGNYYQCGGNWYQPQYVGSQLGYVVMQKPA